MNHSVGSTRPEVNGGESCERTAAANPWTRRISRHVNVSSSNGVFQKAISGIRIRCILKPVKNPSVLSIDTKWVLIMSRVARIWRFLKQRFEIERFRAHVQFSTGCPRPLRLRLVPVKLHSIPIGVAQMARSLCVGTVECITIRSSAIERKRLRHSRRRRRAGMFKCASLPFRRELPPFTISASR